MCSIGEDDFGDEGGVHAMVPNSNTTETSLILETSVCNKCQNNGAIYKLPFREAECRECFLHYVRHKFRAALGSSKILPKDANVLVVFDGSAQSLVLLDMLHHAQKQNAFKRMHCNVSVIIIDDWHLMNEVGTSTQNEGNKDFLLSLSNILRKFDGFKSFFIPLVHQKKADKLIFPLETLSQEYFDQKIYQVKQEFLNDIISIKSLTSRQDFLKLHRKKLLSVAAYHLKCNFVFMPEISPDLATDLLYAVALGRGGSAALDVALVDDRLGEGLMLCRPLRDLSSNEIQLYVEAQELPVLKLKRYGDDAESLSSLQNITKAFILNLQDNFSSTVSTVFRTGSKIATKQDMDSRLRNLQLSNEDDGSSNRWHCSYCNSLLDYRDSKTLLAIEFSRVVSESGRTLDQCGKLNATAEKNLMADNAKNHFRNLCHGCRNIFSDNCNDQILLED